MSKLKKVAIAVLLPLTLLGSFSAQAADIPGEQFVISNPPTNDRYTGINLADSQFNRETYSALEAFTANGTSRNSQMLTRNSCTSIGSPGCESDKWFAYHAQLGMCGEQYSTDCVSKVFAKGPDGIEHQGTFVKYFPGDTEFSYKGDPSIGLPPGASTFIVDFPDFPHQGGTKYLVVAAMTGFRAFNQTQFQVDDFTSGIFAISEVAGSFSVTKPEKVVRPDFTLYGNQATAGGFKFGPDDGTGIRRTACVQTSSTSCALPWRMPLNVDFGLSFKLHEKIAGWLHGRLTDAQSTISTNATGDQLLTIQGKPSIIPGIFGWAKKSEYPPTLKAFYQKQDQTNNDANGLGWPSIDGKTNNGPEGLPYSIMKEGFGYDEGSFAEVLAWIGALGDKAAYDQSVWSVRTLSGGTGQDCWKNTNTLSGIVSTNSTMYVGAPPTFDKASQSLDYKVVSPHYLKDGTEFKGSYDLVIKSDVARCIYGFTSAPVSATISIVSADGTSQIATTTFTEKDGWMYLTARNFTFSSPTVRVTLKQASSENKSEIKTPAKVAIKKITCTKGKTKKVVQGANPLCPSGFKLTK